MVQLLYFVDNRTLPIMLSNYTSCTYYCSSRMSAFENLAGQPACCDGEQCFDSLYESCLMLKARLTTGIMGLAGVYVPQVGKLPDLSSCCKSDLSSIQADCLNVHTQAYVINGGDACRTKACVQFKATCFGTADEAGHLPCHYFISDLLLTWTICRAVEFLEQTFPYRYLLAPYPGDLVVYYTQLQATFSASFDCKASHWRHQGSIWARRRFHLITEPLKSSNCLLQTAPIRSTPTT